ncbi:MAG: hypothetical protein DBY25_06165 [Clostridiales bacterium]|nr:MAG: hypothetical protein DBY25_06165 [Clostridiales bacterium]
MKLVCCVKPGREARLLDCWMMDLGCRHFHTVCNALPVGIKQGKVRLTGRNGRENGFFVPKITMPSPLEM